MATKRTVKRKPRPPKRAPKAAEKTQQPLSEYDAARAEPVTMTAGTLDSIIGDNYGRSFYGAATTVLNAAHHVAIELEVVVHALRDDAVYGGDDIENTIYLLSRRLRAAADITAAQIVAERAHKSAVNAAAIAAQAKGRAQ